VTYPPHCPACNRRMKPLWTSWFCPAECDLPLHKRTKPRYSLTPTLDDIDLRWDVDELKTQPL